MFKIYNNILPFMFFKKLINKGYEAQNCSLCQVSFTSFKFERIHKCKRCLKFICSQCGETKQFVIDQQGKRTTQRHRICKHCRADIYLIRDKIAEYEMQWQRDSRFSLSWLNNLKKEKDIDYQHEHFISLYFKGGSNFHEQTQIIDKDVIKGRTDFNVFNYSIKEFFCTIQQNVQYQYTTRLNIARVLYAIAARYSRVGYCQGMSGIAAFLLCFASQESSYIIFCDLLDNIFPQRFLERSDYGVALIGLLAETHFLKEYYEHYIKNVKHNLLFIEREQHYSQQQISHTKMIIELAATKSLLSVFIGVLNFTNLMFVWQELKNKRDFEVIQKAFIAIIYINRKNILEERSYKKLQVYFEQLDAQLFMETYHDIYIDYTLKQKFIKEYFTQCSKKWNTSGTGNNYTLSKVTKFTQNQIKELQNYFCHDFKKQDFIEKVVINMESFCLLIEIYFKILKQYSQEGNSILQINTALITKIYRNYCNFSQEGLVFRQFICCFSVCTKSELKERICAILRTHSDSNHQILLQNFNHLIKIIYLLTPIHMQLKKNAFTNRVLAFYVKNGNIDQGQMQILLNDQYINEMNLIICCEVKEIMALTIQQYSKKISQRNLASQNSIQQIEKVQKEQQVEEKMIPQDIITQQKQLQKQSNI